MRKKFIIGFSVFIAISTLIIFLANNYGVYGSYECVTYNEISGDSNINVLEKYRYYNLKLNRDKTFTLTYLVKEVNASEQTATGTFRVKGNRVTLTYDQGQQPIETALFENEIYTFKNRQLSRNQSAYYEPTNFETTIIQKFKKV